MVFFPKVDAAVLTFKHPPLHRPNEVAPIFDIPGSEVPIEPWTKEADDLCYRPKAHPFAISTPPSRPSQCESQKYLRATLAKNEHLRLSMLWYYTRDILQEADFLSGLQEKVRLAHEATGWDCAIIGTLDVNYYIRLAAVGTPPGILPRGETICAHIVAHDPGNVFLLPNLLDDWRYQGSPYVEKTGLRAYAATPLRLQDEFGESVCLGSLCVSSQASQEPLTKNQQLTLVHLADWLVSDMVQCVRARRQRVRHNMSQLLATAQLQVDHDESEEPVFSILRTIYPDAIVTSKPNEAAQLDYECRRPILMSDIKDGLWEDTEYLDDLIMNSNNRELPTDRVVRVITAQCETMAGPSLLVVASKDFQLIFDDIDLWFMQSCATMLSQMRQKRLLAEAMRAKEKFLRGISHQLRTPIHGILGSVELLAEELRTWATRLDTAASRDSNGGHSVYLDTIKTSGRDLISIVNSMITLNRWADIAMEERRFATCTIQEFETELANETHGASTENARLRASLIFDHRLPAKGLALRTDHSLLRNSLLPLVINAMQYSPGGVVQVTTSTSAKSNEVVFDIVDTGCGIHADDQERIFEPYEKVGVHSTGGGLGLTLSSKFASLLHGSVVLVSSDPEHGSHFRATFRDVESVSTPQPDVPLVPELKHLPSTFYTPQKPGLMSLTDCLSNSLRHLGFTASDDLQTSFLVLDFTTDPDRRRTGLSLIPEGHVAVCLIPGSERGHADPQPDNVVYVSGPFHAPAIVSALVEADRLLSKMQQSQPPPLVTPTPTAPITVDDAAVVEPRAVPPAPPAIGTRVTAPAQDNTTVSPDILDLPSRPSAPVPSAPPSDGPRPTTPKPEGISPGPSPNAEATTSRPKVLIVDDNNINLRIMQMYCSKRGLPYQCATDGKQAVELFTKQQASAAAAAGDGESFRLVLMDLQMPVCDGIEATRQMRALEQEKCWDRTPLFIVTGQDNPEDRKASAGVGADEYFVKPVGMNILDQTLKRYYPGFSGARK